MQEAELQLHAQGVVCRRFFDDRVAAAVVCFTKYWDKLIADSQLLEPEQLMALQEQQPFAERPFPVNYSDGWGIFNFGLLMFAAPEDLVDIAFPGLSFRNRKDAVRLFQRNAVTKIDESGEERCKFTALLSSGVDFPSSVFEDDLTRLFGADELGADKLDALIQENLKEWEKKGKKAKLRRVLRTAANSMRVTLNSAMKMHETSPDPLFRGLSNHDAEYGTAFVGEHDMTANMRSTSASYRTARGFATDGNPYIHIFLIGDPDVRCVSVKRVLSGRLSILQCFPEEQETILGADNILIPMPFETGRVTGEAVKEAITSYTLSRKRDDPSFGGGRIRMPRFCENAALEKWNSDLASQTNGIMSNDLSRFRLFLVLPKGYHEQPGGATYIEVDGHQISPYYQNAALNYRGVVREEAADQYGDHGYVPFQSSVAGVARVTA